MTALQQVAEWARLDDKDLRAGIPPVTTRRLILEFKARQVDALERIAEALEQAEDRARRSLGRII